MVKVADGANLEGLPEQLRNHLVLSKIPHEEIQADPPKIINMLIHMFDREQIETGAKKDD